MKTKSFRKIIKTYLPTSIANFIKDRFSFTQRPSVRKSVISEQFPYRNGIWKTHFELLNLPNLYDPISFKEEYVVRFVFFDLDGNVVMEHEIINHNKGKSTIDLDSILPVSLRSKVGTFSCFHKIYPSTLYNSNAYLTERGYVGYQLKELTKTKAYVHGNYDAIAEDYKNNLMSLGTSKVQKRTYFLQHQLTGPAIYELVFVNTTPKTQKLIITLENSNQATANNETLTVPSRGLRIFKVEISNRNQSKVSINSHLSMARPVVFRTAQNTFDVFHG